MKIGPAGEDRQGFVGRVTAEIRPQIHGMAWLRQEVQIGPVGIVHQQKGPVPVAHLGQLFYALHQPQIVRAGDVHRCRGPGQGREGLVQLLPGHGAGAKAPTRLGPEPPDRQIQQGSSVDKAPVHIPGRQDQPVRPGRAAGEGQTQHGPDAQAGALGGVQSPGGAE